VPNVHAHWAVEVVTTPWCSACRTPRCG